MPQADVSGVCAPPISSVVCRWSQKVPRVRQKPRRRCRRRWRCCSSPAATCRMSPPGASSSMPPGSCQQVRSAARGAATLSIVARERRVSAVQAALSAPTMTQTPSCWSRLASREQPVTAPHRRPVAVHGLRARAVDVPAAQQEHVRRRVHRGRCGQGRVGPAQRGEVACRGCGPLTTSAAYHCRLCQISMKIVLAICVKAYDSIQPEWFAQSSSTYDEHHRVVSNMQRINC